MLWEIRNNIIVFVLRKFEKDSTEGQAGSTLIILHSRNLLHKPNIHFKS